VGGLESLSVEVTPATALCKRVVDNLLA